MIFNGRELRTVHRALSIEKEIPPGTAARTIETMSAAEGEIITQERIERGEYIVRVNIAGRNAAEAWEARELLAQWATLPGIGTAELIPTHRPSRAYDARLLSISEPEFKRGGAVVEVRFLLPRPLAHDIYESVIGGAGGMEMTISGSHACRPAFKQTIAAARDGVIWRINNGAFMTLTGNLTAGQVVEMDTARESLTIDGAHAEERLNVTWTRWRPGYNPGTHQITSTDGGKMEARWRNVWA